MRRRSKAGMAARTSFRTCTPRPRGVLSLRHARPVKTLHPPSRRFRARSVNVSTGPKENRLLLTGLHVVADIYCNNCDTRIGWKYVRASRAFERSRSLAAPATARCARPSAAP